jgi:hypothetical protein
MPRKRIASARITAELGSDGFDTATFAFWLSVSMPRGFTHRAAATIEEIESVSSRANFAKHADDAHTLKHFA